MPIKTSKEQPSELQKALNVMDRDLQDFLANEKVDPKIIKKILALGDPFKKAVRVLGKDKTTNPILAFVLQEYVQKNLLANNKLNAQTFKAIYNAVANKYVVDSEFFKDNDYNIIYCLDLYNKKPAEMEEYLKLQVKILKFSKEAYTDKIKAENKQAFIFTNIVNEPEIKNRAKALKDKLDIFTNPALSIKNSKLNNIDLVKAIVGTEREATVKLDTVGQDKLVKTLDKLSKIFVTLLSLSLSTKSKKAREAMALYRSKFASIKSDEIIEATRWLAQNNIIPKGQLQVSDADTLADKICARIAEF